MTPRRTTAALVAVALASGAGGAAVYGLADAGGSSPTTTALATPVPTAHPAAAVKTSGGLSVNQIYRQANAGVVDIKVRQSSSAGPDQFGGGNGNGNGSGQESQAEGSGFVIDADGHVATNQHVVDGATSITVTFADGKTASAKVVGTDPSSDVGVIKVDAPKSELHPLAFGDSNDVQVGDGVVAIGSPFGLEETVTSGIVSALHRAIQGMTNFTINDSIQTDAAINHRNPGGPVLNPQGQVVGVNAQIKSDSGGNEGVGFSIPSATVKTVASQLIASGKAVHAYLGVRIDATAPNALLAGAQANTPAGKAGLKKGDVVTAVDGTTVASGDDLSRAIDAHKPGDKVTITYQRGGSEHTVSLTLATRPN